MAYSVPTESEIRNALTYIDATERQTWVSVGTALKTRFILVVRLKLLIYKVNQ